ncbi:hypothetical protein MIR68_009870 [Amoeboaphelidium protococcarum]|nr:hypothetical protein MIR68_009870 [Amoeboaphelidium protococcarum]
MSDRITTFARIKKGARIVFSVYVSAYVFVKVNHYVLVKYKENRVQQLTQYRDQMMDKIVKQ